MNTQMVVMLMIIALLGVATMLIAMKFAAPKAASVGSENSRSLRRLTAEYRNIDQAGKSAQPDESQEAPGHFLNPSQLDSQSAPKISRDSLQARIKYAQLDSIPAYAFGLMQIAISLFCFLLARIYLREALQIASLFTGPLLVNWFINRRISRRVARFDADFPQFLLSVVGMLKTGLNPTQALQAAAENLEIDSVVREEVELMLERFRVGVPEEQSIGAFGEDVQQPEIELFVQALILSRRVGGNLSFTLDRLAKQVRRRHAFKLAAHSTVSMQRGSIWMIVGIMVAVQLYILSIVPDMVIGAWTHPSLAGKAQAVLVVIFLALYWMKRITNVKI
jgi:tight adherence protein B